MGFSVPAGVVLRKDSPELSPRTFCNFAGEFSSFRRQRARRESGADLAYVLPSLSRLRLDQLGVEYHAAEPPEVVE